jgi:flavin reductase (DIM6/NTAB) family NADH-FMN oxidoreductase RutF
MMKKSFGPQTLAYPTPVFIIGTYDTDGRPNVMTAAWAGICCSNPPAVSVSLRQNRHTYTAIVERKSFTISIPSEEHVREADYFGIVSGKKSDKFAITGLTPIRSELVDAPYVGEFPMVLECRLLQTVPLGTHDLFIGEIMDVKVEEHLLLPDGNPDIEKIKPLIFAPGSQSYYGVGPFVEKAFSIGKTLKK